MASGFLPLFKNLLKTVRDQSHAQQNEFEENRRDLEELTKFRNTYLDQLVDSERRIIISEKALGVNEPSDL
jgi:hypothetical protein